MLPCLRSRFRGGAYGHRLLLPLSWHVSLTGAVVSRITVIW
jgi:hypothetical protein